MFDAGTVWSTIFGNNTAQTLAAGSPWITATPSHIRLSAGIGVQWWSPLGLHLVYLLGRPV
ncbi:BamA/TamA family outer membrane protein [Klebsiella pneumoniae]|nr:BamA/TamA family outer membrane protein [Klebsiella pneumoniae]